MMTISTHDRVPNKKPIRYKTYTTVTTPDTNFNERVHEKAHSFASNLKAAKIAS